MKRLEDFENWKVPRKVDFPSAAGAHLWEQHWINHERLLALMRECEQTAIQIRQAVKDATL